MNAREKILKAADKFFGTKSFSEVSIAPILQEADVQAPTLYYHFGDKEGLYVCWLDSTASGMRAQLGIRSDTSLEDGLAAFASIYFVAAKFDYGQILRDMPSLPKEETKESAYGAYFKAVYEPLCAILIGGMERGELPAEPVGRLADIFLAGLFALHPTVEKDPAGVAAWYAKRFLRGHLA